MRAARRLPHEIAGDLPAAADGSFRKGRVFALRLTRDEETRLRELQAEHERQTSWWNRYGSDHERGGFGPFIVWAALQYQPPHKKAKAKK